MRPPDQGTDQCIAEVGVEMNASKLICAAKDAAAIYGYKVSVGNSIDDANARLTYQVGCLEGIVKDLCRQMTPDTNLNLYSYGGMQFAWEVDASGDLNIQAVYANGMNIMEFIDPAVVQEVHEYIEINEQDKLLTAQEIRDSDELIRLEAAAAMRGEA